MKTAEVFITEKVGNAYQMAVFDDNGKRQERLRGALSLAVAGVARGECGGRLMGWQGAVRGIHP